MGFIQEFKEFAVKGNVIDLAVGVIIGAAFGKVVSSLVADVVTPPLGLLLSQVDFSQIAITLKQASAPGANDAVKIMIGKFIQACVDFTIVAIAIFIIVKMINTMKRRFEAEKAATPVKVSPEQQLLTEIRDLLKSK